MTALATEHLLLTAADVEIKAAGGKRKLPRIDIVAYSGGLMNVPSWGTVAIDVDGLDAAGQVALLADHDARVSGVVGHGAASVAEGKVLVTGVVSGTSDAAKHIVAMSQGGFAFQASVGVEPIEHERIAAGDKVEVNGRVLSSPRGFTLVRRGKLREVSITPLGADASTSVAIAASFHKQEVKVNTEVQIDEQQVRADERQRLQRIEAVCAGPASGWGNQQERVNQIKAAAIAGEITEQELMSQMLGILRDSRPKVSFANRPIQAVSNAATIEAALLLRMGMSALGEQSLGAVAMEQGEHLKVTHMLDLCRAALMLEHQDVPHGREELVKAALSTYSLPVALGNLANKLLLDSYNESPATWRAFCAIRSTNDFKPNTAIRPSFATPLDKLAPGGEIKHGTVGEWTAQYQVDTFAKMLSIDRRDLINDDLGAFDDTSRALGRAAMRSLSDLVYRVLLANGGSFFSAGNGNYFDGASSALTFEGLAMAIQLMMVQRDEEGNDLDLRPRTLLVPPELQTQAKSLLESEFIQQIAEKVPTGNSLRKAVSLEVEPRLSNTGKFGSAASDVHWYLFAAPSAVPMVVAFLEGKQSPTVEYFGLDHQVNRLAASWRVYHDFGTALVDFRAAVRSKGEA